MLLTALLLVPADFGSDSYSPPVLQPTTGDIRHSGHTVAEKTDSQTISILTISHFRRQQLHLEL